jgi:hypothetical protein
MTPTVVHSIRSLFSRKDGIASLQEITRMAWANFQYPPKNGKLTFKIVEIGQASVFHLHGPDAHHSIHEKRSYH